MAKLDYCIGCDEAETRSIRKYRSLHKYDYDPFCWICAEVSHYYYETDKPFIDYRKTKWN